jgi:FAD:protein FMN transferase
VSERIGVNKPVARIGLAFVRCWTVAELGCLVANRSVADELKRYEFDETAMGTQFRVVFYTTDRERAVTAVTSVFRRVRELETVMSDYKSTSEIMKLCAANDAEPNVARPISADLARVVRASLDVSQLSDGAFDVTIGPLSKLWRDIRKSKMLPPADTLATAKAKVGWRNVELDSQANTLKLKQAGMRLDFGGIGKGFAADEAMSVLKSLGISQALVAAAGDITVSAAPPEREAWQVEIAGIGTGQPKRTVKLVNASVSTSGDLFQHVEINGVRYSHILDPKTGLGLTGRRSVTVIAPNGTLATFVRLSASVLEPHDALKCLAKLPGVAVFLATKSDDVSPVIETQSMNFASYLLK